MILLKDKSDFKSNTTVENKMNNEELLEHTPGTT